MPNVENAMPVDRFLDPTNGALSHGPSGTRRTQVPCTPLSLFRYVVNITVLIYQLGSCAVPIVFVSTNLNNVGTLGPIGGPHCPLRKTVEVLEVVRDPTCGPFRVLGSHWGIQCLLDAHL